MRYALTARTSVVALLALVAVVGAEVVPGDVIDQRSWQKAEGLLPDSVLAWVKRGDWVMSVGELEYEPRWSKSFESSSESNAGRYGLDAEGGLIDAKTGVRPPYTFGFPFPKIDTAEPRVAERIMWNRWFAFFQTGRVRVPLAFSWVGRGGFERTAKAIDRSLYYDGGSGGAIDNPETTEMRSLTRITDPSYLEGFTVLTWRFMDNRADNFWSYIPALRRVRQLTAANRSDAFVGTDCTLDDQWLWFAKQQSFTWKFVREGTYLVPFAQKAPLPLRAADTRERGTTWEGRPDQAVAWGYLQSGAQTAPWSAANRIWVKRPLYVLEGEPKESYYNYGRHVFYVDKVSGVAYYKVVYTRAGEYWKTMLVDLAPAFSPDGETRLPVASMFLCIDDRNDHATVVEPSSPQHPFVFNGDEEAPETFVVDELLRVGK